ncbi:phosphate starvation-inducible protein PhoH [candidate division LCP-89 bacterium B3_LCP]|uniref:PhoH-like protein n=1 Tax=candidate division LCP-89 bacterium B3_LCP TaxID=2012998 RepID=A0A532URM6_UNCL8|nr:MAG: phosphate starvation-inducible protein PhoH [candidate division LCP-89 bacterium B3_LCP]
MRREIDKELNIESEEPPPEERFEIPLKNGELFNLAGIHDRNLKALRAHLNAKIIAKNDSILITASPPEDLNLAKNVVEEILNILRHRGSVDVDDVETVLRLMSDNDQPDDAKTPSGFSTIETPQKPIYLRSANQEAYYQTSQSKDIVFAVGPAGTGKTYLAVAMAVQALTRHEVKRIILVRPAVEAGENLGFLPGDLKEKVDPYFRPLYDALMDMIPPDRVKRLIERNTIEIAPLAYMRGRTLSNSFVILDEAQNTTAEQMMMFLTRLGMHSKALITGDETQIDLRNKDESGLLQAPQVLKKIKGISFVQLTEKDAVRHELVRRIINAYSDYHNGNNNDKTEAF